MQLFSYYFVFFVRFILFSCLFMYVMLICLINFSRFVGDTGTNIITKVYLITNILRIMSNKSWVGETFLGLTLLLLLLRQFACRTWIQIFRICSFTTRKTRDFVLYSFLFFLFCEIWPHCYRLNVNFGNCLISSSFHSFPFFLSLQQALSNPMPSTSFIVILFPLL